MDQARQNARRSRRKKILSSDIDTVIEEKGQHRLYGSTYKNKQSLPNTQIFYEEQKIIPIPNMVKVCVQI